MINNIVCNTRCLNSALTGTQRYTKKILDNLPQQIQTITPGMDISHGMKGHLWEQLALSSKIKGKLLWSPSNAGPVNYKKQVLSFHDTVSIDHPEWLNKYYVKWYDYILPKLCKNVDHIITISEYSKQRILELFDVPESKVSMIYNGVDDIIGSIDPDAKPLELPFKKYVLSLGSLEPRKNIAMLIKAWGNILDQIPEDVGLVIAGGTGVNRIFKDPQINSIPDRVHFTGRVEDHHIAQLYRDAMFFVYLSIYEGFGLPPLEAMSAGTPVLTGNRTSLPEVVGDAGVMIDPYSISECENNLIKMINNDGLRSELAIKSKQQAKKFDWKDTAKQTWEVLERYSY